MKKEVCAAGIILCLIAGAVWNVYHLENLAGRMTEHIRAAETAEAEGRSLRAEQELRLALEIWLDADGYTHIFIRHAEIDSTSDAFYEALTALSGGDTEEFHAACEKLRYHIDSIVSMEHITPRSVL